MGTRGFIGFANSNDCKIGYNHFDSYPSGLGVDVCEAVVSGLETLGLDRLRELTKALAQMDDSHDVRIEDIERLKDAADLNVSTQQYNDWYCLTRGLQGDYLNTLKSGYTYGEKDWPRDSLFCEWGYVVDVDAETVEIYQGFNQSQAKGRWSVYPANSDGYFPVTLIATVSFDDLVKHKDELQSFVLSLIPEEEEE